MPLIRTQLTQGTAPDRLAWAVACGVTLGCFPVFGTTTLLCLAAGALLRLNQPVLQAVNYAVTPLQVALMIPFWRLGDALFSAPSAPLHPRSVRDLFAADAAGALSAYGLTAARGAAAWLLAALPASFLLYRLALAALRRGKFALHT